MFKAWKTGIESQYSVTSSTPTCVSQPWTITAAVNNKTKSKVSIWTFDKKSFEANMLNMGVIRSKSSQHDKQILNDAYDLLRKQVSNMIGFRHPDVLKVVEPLEEHKSRFLFVTENVIGTADTVDLDEFAITKGILQVTKGLAFLHDNNKVHLGISPTTIFITEAQDWKLGGFGFCQDVEKGFMFGRYDPRVPKFLNLQWGYSAPELVLEEQVNVKNDIFSLGALCYFLYTKRTMMTCDGESYRDEYNKFSRGIVRGIPDKLEFHRLVHRDMYERFSAAEFMECSMFQDPKVKTMFFLDELPGKSDEEKLVFLQGLVPLLGEFPNTILHSKFLPILVSLLPQAEGEVFKAMLTNILHIGGTLSALSFNEKISPSLYTLSSNDAYEVIIENFGKVLSKVNDVPKLVVPMIGNILKAKQPVTTLQDKFLLSAVPQCLDKLTFLNVKNDLVPAIKDLFSTTTSFQVKVATIKTFECLLVNKKLDVLIVTETVIPLFQAMKTRDATVMMASLEVFRNVNKVDITEEYTVSHVIPLIWTFSIAATLDAAQYKEYCSVITLISQHVMSLHARSLGDKTVPDFKTVVQTPFVKKEEQEPQIEAPALLPRKKNEFKEVIEPHVRPKKIDIEPLPVRKREEPKKVEPLKLGGEPHATMKPLRFGQTTSQPLQPKFKSGAQSSQLPQSTHVSTAPTPHVLQPMHVAPAPAPQLPQSTHVTPAATQTPPKSPPATLPPGFSMMAMQPQKRSATPTSTFSSDSLL